MTKASRMSAAHAALLGLMDRYLAALMDPFITLLEVHRLMYFLQIAGEPLRLRYVKGPVCPHAENLRHVLREFEGHLISAYADGGDSLTWQLVPVPGAMGEAATFLEAHPDTHERFDRVSHLVEGFETPFGLELLTTVHWVVAQEKAEERGEILRGVYSWALSKRRFTADQIDLTVKRLQSEGWLPGVLRSSGARGGF